MALWSRAAPLRHVIEEPVRLAVGCPLGAKARPPLDAAKRGQQEAVELAGVRSPHEAVDMKTFGRRGDGALDELFEQRPDDSGALRADFGDEMEVGIGHDASLSAGRPRPKAGAVYTKRRANSSARPEGAWGRVTGEIIVTDYDPNWPSWFETIRRTLWPVVDGMAIRIDHVGSTAVAGLAAKPIIDLDLVVASPDEVGPVIGRLALIGCPWRGDLGVVRREAFGPLPMEGLRSHHLYLVVENNRAHVDHWLLRDLLREDPKARARYAALKRRNAELAKGDIDFYVAAKAGLVAELLTRARALKGLPPETYWDPLDESS